MKLVVAVLLLVSAVAAAAAAVEHVAPEAASASASPPVGGARARAVVGPETPAAVATGDPVVAAVRLTGPGLRAASLAEAIHTRPGAPLDAATLEADRARVLDALIARGHLDAAVGAPRVRAAGAGAVRVELPVAAGPIYAIRSIAVTGRGARAHAALARVPTLRPGDDAAADRIDAGAALLRGWLAARRLRGRVTVEIDRDPAAAHVDVIYRVD